MAMPLEMPSFFGSLNECGSPSPTLAKRPNANYFELSMPDLYNSQCQHANNSHVSAIETAMPTYGGELDQAPEAAQHLHSPLNVCTCQLGFIPLNMPDLGLQNHETDTASPLQTSFEPSFEPSFELSFDSSPCFSNDNIARSATSSTFGSTLRPINASSPNKHRRYSTWTGSGDGLAVEDSSPISTTKPMGRRRKSEQGEPGSARAIYLEKNRKAASKCRGKQRTQQQELVVTAREMERMNKQLKAEAILLKSDMHNLMMIVGRHSGCPDRRLKTYIQGAADRLSSRNPAKTSPSSSAVAVGAATIGSETLPFK